MSTVIERLQERIEAAEADSKMAENLAWVYDRVADSASFHQQTTRGLINLGMRESQVDDHVAQIRVAAAVVAETAERLARELRHMREVCDAAHAAAKKQVDIVMSGRPGRGH